MRRFGVGWRGVICMVPALVLHGEVDERTATPARAASELIVQALKHQEVEEYKEALALLDQVVRDFDANRDIHTRYQVLDALLRKVWVLEAMGAKPEEFSACCEAFAARYKADVHDYFYKAAVKFAAEEGPIPTMVSWAEGMTKPGEWRMALLISHAVTDQYEKTPEAFPSREALDEGSYLLRHHETVMKALEGLGELDKALVARDKLLERYEDCRSDEEVAHGFELMMGKAELLRKMGRLQEAVATCDEVEARWKMLFGEDREADSRPVSKAKLIKGRLLLDLNRDREGRKVLDEACAGYVGREGLPPLELTRSLLEKAREDEFQGKAPKGSGIALTGTVILRCERDPDPRVQALAAHVAYLRLESEWKVDGKDEASLQADWIRRMGPDRKAYFVQWLKAVYGYDATTRGEVSALEQMLSGRRTYYVSDPCKPCLPIPPEFLDFAIERIRANNDDGSRPLLLNALRMKARRDECVDHFQEALAAWDEAVRLGWALNQEKNTAAVFQDMFSKARALAVLQRPDDAFAAFHEIELKVLECRKRKIQVDGEYLYFAIERQAVVHMEQGRYNESIVEFERALAHANGQVDVRELKNAMIAIARAHASDHQYQKAVAGYDRAIAHYSGWTFPEIGEALNEKANCLKKLGRKDAARKVHDFVLERFGKQAGADCGEALDALSGKGLLLVESGQGDKAIALFDGPLAQAGAEGSPWPSSAKPLLQLKKAYFLGEAGRIDEALSLIREVSRTEDPELRRVLDGAWTNVGFAQLLRAKRRWQEKGRTPEVIKDLEASLELSRKVSVKDAYALGNEAYALFLLGRVQDAEAPLRETLRKGGRALYDGELEDATIHPVPPDAEFTALLKRIWGELGGKS